MEGRREGGRESAAKFKESLGLPLPATREGAERTNEAVNMRGLCFLVLKLWRITRLDRWVKGVPLTWYILSLK